MKKMKTMLLMIGIVLSASAYAQMPQPRVSPPYSVTGKIGDATISINYSSPSVKGRKIWGGLVPYDTVWRAGANEATTFKTDKDLKIGNAVLPAGKYAFFLIPSKDRAWVAIFNTVTYQWGAFKYDKNKDQLRVNVSTVPLQQSQEGLIYKIGPDGFSLNWDKRSVFIPVNTIANGSL
jgi:hypothetical protein